jgi:hypothetical protein
MPGNGWCRFFTSPGDRENRQLAKPPEVAGEPIAELMLSYPDRNAINGALFKLGKRVAKPDRAMHDEVFGKRLWEELVQLTEQTGE